MKAWKFVLTILILKHQVVFAAAEVKKELFDNGQVSKELYYDNGKLVEERYFSYTGTFTNWIRYTYTADSHVIKISLSNSKENYGQVTGQEEWEGLTPSNQNGPNSHLIKKWNFAKEAPYALEYIAYLDRANENKILQKEYLDDSGKLKSTITFTYKDGQEKPVQFVEKDATGKVISKFSLYEKYDLVGVLKAQGKSDEEIALRKKHREDPRKFLIAVIDSGFDYNHEGLVEKWWNNPSDPVDGIDNDKNGWIDDNFGWDQVKNVGLPTESTIAMDKDERPLSHGTHVAHIAVRDIPNAALVGFAGDYTRPEYIRKISVFIKKHKIRIVNMSLGFPSDIKDSFGLRDGIQAYRQMIDDNPETLFVVASGNEMKDLDNDRNKQYPANFSQANVMKVGSIDASDIESINPETVTMSDFSNFGKTMVDILAPGRAVKAASLGGGLISHSGTSMATPFMVNQIVRLWSELPQLTVAQVKQLFIATAKPLKIAPAIVSRGYVDEKGALLQGKIEMLTGKSSKKEGPNCWNESTYLADISKGIHHTVASEFANIIDSPLCVAVPLEQSQRGDIIALRHFDSKGRMFNSAMLSEVHGYTNLGDGTGLTKNGTSQEAPYQIMSTEQILSFYKSADGRFCKQMGIDRVDCNLKPLAYRCNSLESYMKDKGGLNIFEQDVLQTMAFVEKSLMAQALGGSALKFDKDQMLDQLVRQVQVLKTKGSLPMITDYMEDRIVSLGNK